MACTVGPNHAPRPPANPVQQRPLRPNGAEERQTSARGWPVGEAFEIPRTGPIRPTGAVSPNAPVVIVHDGGVDNVHEDLDASMWVNPNEVKGDGKDNDGSGIPDDVHGANVVTGSGDSKNGPHPDHGTHCAGIIAAEDNGTGVTGIAAGKCRVMAVVGQFTPTTELPAFEKGVDYAVKMKKEHGVNIRVLNASFGDIYPDAEVQRRFTAAVQKLADADILFVVAAGNNGQNIDSRPFFPAKVQLPNVICVAATNRSNDRLASFSNYSDKYVDLAAPGESILSTVPNNRYQRFSGTSMATPAVVGAAALLFNKFPEKSAVEVKELLLASVEKDPDLAGKVRTGGKLNVANLPV